jgi:hypothetical protein
MTAPQLLTASVRTGDMKNGSLLTQWIAKYSMCQLL